MLCGNRAAAPNAHYISRADGGLGVEQNIVTLCTEFGRGCHRRYDSGTAQERAEIRAKLTVYLKRHYPDWNETRLRYRKWSE